ncbi:MAG: thioredoxin domain-containing protein [Sphingomonadaceae bacterium]
MVKMLISRRLAGPVRILPILVAGLAMVACDSRGNSAPPPAGRDGPPAESAAPATQDWTQTVTLTPDGGYRMGNPEAKVKLVEFASFTCPHCKDFHLEANGTLKTYVKDGQLSWEYRPFMLNPQDLAAVLMAGCEGPDRFFSWANELYRNHDAWLMPFTRLTEADVKPLAALPADQQLRGLAEAGGMHDFARVRGLPRAPLDQCLTDQERTKKLTEQQEKAINSFDIRGTPTFVLDGKKVEGASDWASLQPKLTEALR